MTNEELDGGRSAGESKAVPLSARIAEGVDRFGERWRTLSRAVGHASRYSRSASLSRRTRLAASRASRHAHTAALLRRCRVPITHSRILQWLLREPDQDLVVIDLEETRTIGPLLGLLDRVVSAQSGRGRGSRIWRGVDRTVDGLARHAVPAIGGCLLGFVIGALAVSGAGADPLWLAALAVAALAGLLALAVDRSREALANSTLVHVTATVLDPGEDHSR